MIIGLLLGSHPCDLFALTPGLPLGPQLCNPFALVTSPKLRLQQFSMTNVQVNSKVHELSILWFATMV